MTVRIMKNIQTQLLSAFESSGLTYDELARRTNLPKSALYRYLNGDTEKIPIDRFQSVCHELHVDAGVILGWKEDQDQNYQAYLKMYLENKVEQDLINTYRSLSLHGKNLLLDRAKELKILYGKKSEDNSAESVHHT